MSIHCNACDTDKISELFPKPKKNKKGELKYGNCKQCIASKSRRLRLKNKFNISEEEYLAILSLQDDVCAICKNPPKFNKNLAVDHDHKTGLIRGLLCWGCNKALGVFRDNLFKFEQTVLYLRLPPATQALGEERYGLKGRVTNKAATVKKLNKELFEKKKK
jgi:hypothetical protein